jgi:hypothetical protein
MCSYAWTSSSAEHSASYQTLSSPVCVLRQTVITFKLTHVCKKQTRGTQLSLASLHAAQVVGETATPKKHAVATKRPAGRSCRRRKKENKNVYNQHHTQCALAYFIERISTVFFTFHHATCLILGVHPSLSDAPSFHTPLLAEESCPSSHFLATIRSQRSRPVVGIQGKRHLKRSRK